MKWVQVTVKHANYAQHLHGSTTGALPPTGEWLTLMRGDRAHHIRVSEIASIAEVGEAEALAAIAAHEESIARLARMVAK